MEQIGGLIEVEVHPRLLEPLGYVHAGIDFRYDGAHSYRNSIILLENQKTKCHRTHPTTSFEVRSTS
jgi:hypothetical protein